MVVQEALLHVSFFPYKNFQEKSVLSCTLEHKAGHVDFLCLPALFCFEACLEDLLLLAQCDVQKKPYGNA